jgi:hypothetical protein
MYNVRHDGHVEETFDTMKEAEEYVFFKCTYFSHTAEEYEITTEE